ncbi:hypothetical protein [Allokutzneria oryzae]|uniref:Uncharacterized protein n=1 Tax=Allokutzneria oryzae TaxID=1378989 RepID=A0ABV6A9F5_9PSEU
MRWHPLTIAVGIVLTTVAGAAWLLPSMWLLMGAASGFATSGST